ncbi:MAG: TetR/AcrR family transcriptional regulator [Phenylobacterium sp.]
MPKFRRRKDARPSEIVAAAFEVFAQKGFAAARLDDIAARAGVSKGAVYLYFETKEDIFRAVVTQALAPNLEPVLAVLAAHPGPFAELVRGIGERLPVVLGAAPVGAVVKMVIGEARNFPELARVWHDQLAAKAIGALTSAVAAAQARGEVRPGDPRSYALSLMAPMLVGVIWRETFVPVGAEPFDLAALFRQHVEAVLHGMILEIA